MSRPSVREALIALEVEGLVEVRMGSGIYVTAQAPAAQARGVDSRARAVRHHPRAPADRVRTGGAGGARRSDRDGEALRAAMKRMEDDIARGVMPIRGDRDFHVALAEASDNAALVRVVTELFDERNNPLFEQLGRHFENAAQLAPGGRRAPRASRARSPPATWLRRARRCTAPGQFA